jgi:hypothetical protein
VGEWSSTSSIELASRYPLHSVRQKDEYRREKAAKGQSENPADQYLVHGKLRSGFDIIEVAPTNAVVTLSVPRTRQIFLVCRISLAF